MSWCFVILGFSVFAQHNLVQNPSFENISACPSVGNQIKLAIGWDTLKAGGGGGPELFNACANPNTNFGVPVNTFGISYQKAKTGNSYSLMGWYLNSTTIVQREYIQNQLVQPMVIGKTYCVKFFVSLTNRSNYAIDELSAYFDDGSIYSSYYAPVVVTPQIKSPTSVFYMDTLNWMKVEGMYTANTNHTYLTLGNFRSNASTSYTAAYPSNSSLVAEYYIDDVSVIDISVPAFAGRDTLLCKNDSVFIGRTPEIGLDCEWFNNTIKIADGAGIWVKPIVSQQYIVKQDLCGIISYDTVNVAIDPTCTIGINELSINGSVSISPNPANGILNISSRFEIDRIEVSNIAGQLLLSEQINQTTHQTNFNHFEEGIYFVKVIYPNGMSVVKKIIKE